LNGTNQTIAQRLHAHRGVAGIPGRIVTRNLPQDAVQFRSGGIDIDAPIEAADRAPSEALGILAQRHEDLWLLRGIAHSQRIEIRRKHADHSIRFGAQSKHSSDHARIAAKPARPQSVAENYYVPAWPVVFRGQEAPS
jgi:hypothetical protein